MVKNEPSAPATNVNTGYRNLTDICLEKIGSCVSSIELRWEGGQLSLSLDLVWAKCERRREVRIIRSLSAGY